MYPVILPTRDRTDRYKIAKPKLYHWATGTDRVQKMVYRLVMVDAHQITLMCLVFISVLLQRTRSPSGLHLPKRIRYMYPSYYNLMGKEFLNLKKKMFNYIDIVFITDMFYAETNWMSIVCRQLNSFKYNCLVLVILFIKYSYGIQIICTQYNMGTDN